MSYKKTDDNQRKYAQLNAVLQQCRGGFKISEKHVP